MRELDELLNARVGNIVFVTTLGRIYVGVRACGHDLRQCLRDALVGIEPPEGEELSPGWNEAVLVGWAIARMVRRRVEGVAVSSTRSLVRCPEVHLDVPRAIVQEVEVLLDLSREEPRLEERVLCEWSLADFRKGVDPVKVDEAGVGVST